MICFRKLLLAWCVCSLPATAAHAQWLPSVNVDAQSSLDWQFAISGGAANAREQQDDTAASSCEIFVPSRYRRDKPTGLVLYLSPGARSQAGMLWRPTLQRQNLLYASPHDVGNNVPVDQRIRVAIDVLQHMRTHYNIDPDRTYLAGFSGGARVAFLVAFAFPEHFGGLMPICAGGRMSRQAWLQDRVAARLRVALITGKADGFRPEVVFRSTILLRECGVETKLWVPAMGHRLPSRTVFAGALLWLERGLAQRRDLAKAFPATRMNDTLAADEWSERLLDEAMERTKDAETLRSGVMLLKGVADRWPETEAGTLANQHFNEFKQQPDQTWSAEQRATEFRLLVATAKAEEAFATADELMSYESQRADYLRSAIEMWKAVGVMAPDEVTRSNAQSKATALKSRR